MTTVSILPVSTDAGVLAFQAVAGDRRSTGKSAGEALDALAAQLPPDHGSLLVVVQQLRSDEFFTREQQSD